VTRLTTLIAATLGLALLLPRCAQGEEPPRLVLLLSVDQLRRDRIDSELPGGLGLLAREGRLYTEAVLDHAMTETCAGHATMLTGRHPGPAGVPGNRFVDAETGRSVYCVDDEAEDARVIGAEHGRSPRLLRASTLGDWMKQRWPESRVFSVSGKDRAAITLGGHRADAAYWLNTEGEIGFTTSGYYRDTLPDWIQQWNGTEPLEDGFLARVPERWEHPEGEARPDDYFAESDRFGRTSGHPVRKGDAGETVRRFASTPFLDDMTLELARLLIEHERLGADASPDLLAIGLSASDYIGHLYGPESAEALDALKRLDASLGEFLSFLEERIGEGRTLVALTADHGVLPLPEWMAETGRSQCSVEGGRIGLRRFGLRFFWHVHWKFSPLFSMPGKLVRVEGSQLRVNRGLARSGEIDVAAVISDTEAWLEAQAGIREVWTRQELASRHDPIAELYRHSFDEERSGDLAVQLEPTCVLALEKGGTTHGTPYLYDRAVPILLYGPGIEPGHVRTPARTIDIAPTLATRLGIPFPDDLDGVPLD
jgi:predicted AlkP superfamily pyrophosphatase or phosphodiesterase